MVLKVDVDDPAALPTDKANKFEVSRAADNLTVDDLENKQLAIGHPERAIIGNQ